MKTADLCGETSTHTDRSCVYCTREKGHTGEHVAAIGPYLDGDTRAPVLKRWASVPLVASSPKPDVAKYDAARERFQRDEIRKLRQVTGALVRQMMEAHLVPRVSRLDVAADPPEILSRFDPATGDDVLWVASSPQQEP